MSQAADALPPREVEPFPLTAEILHMCFQLHTPTLPRIPFGLELQVRDAWIAEVQAVTLHPHDVERWVRLLAIWLCVLPTYQPSCARDRRASTRALCERQQVEQSLQIWHEPSSVHRLLSHVMDRVQTPAHGRRQTPTRDPQVRRSRRLASLGRYRDAVAALSQSPPAVPSDSSLARLELLHPTTPSMPPPPSLGPATITVTCA